MRVELRSVFLHFEGVPLLCQCFLWLAPHLCVCFSQAGVRVFNTRNICIRPRRVLIIENLQQGMHADGAGSKLRLRGQELLNCLFYLSTFQDVSSLFFCHILLVYASKLSANGLGKVFSHSHQFAISIYCFWSLVSDLVALESDANECTESDVECRGTGPRQRFATIVCGEAVVCLDKGGGVYCTAILGAVDDNRCSESAKWQCPQT